MTIGRSLSNLSFVALLICSAVSSERGTQSPRVAFNYEATPARTRALAAPRGLHRRTNAGALPSAARAQISFAIGRDQIAYRAIPQAGGFRMDNPTQALSAKFSPSDVSFRVRSDVWGIALSGYGYGDNLRPASAVRPVSDANRIEYRRDGLAEWYENGPFGIEQGFTFVRTPGKSHGEPLTLTLALSGELNASIDPDKRALTLRKNGFATLRYAGLAARDANGRQLNAWMELAENRLRLRVDDSGAQYPVTVDPTFQLA